MAKLPKDVTVTHSRERSEEFMGNMKKSDIVISMDAPFEGKGGYYAVMYNNTYGRVSYVIVAYHSRSLRGKLSKSNDSMIDCPSKRSALSAWKYIANIIAGDALV